MKTIFLIKKNPILQILLPFLLSMSLNANVEASTIYLPHSVTLGSQEYPITEKNIVALKELADKGIKVKISGANLNDKDKSSSLCRTWYPIVPKGAISFGNFVKEALKSELTDAGIYSETDGVELTIQVEEIDFDSFSGKWKYQINISAPGKSVVTMKYEYPFETHYVAGAACKAVANAFVPGIQNFLSMIYLNQNFVDLLAK